jgi:MurNAc alpha-1-phosphate uridylyltransferase
LNSQKIAFVLAAGKGERLRPLTEKTPKPLLPLRGRPILEHVLRSLERQGFERVVVNAWYHADQIESYVNSSVGRFAFELRVSREKDLLGTGGGLRQALPLLGSESFWMMNGDSLWVGELPHLSLEEVAEGSWILVPQHADQTKIGVKNSFIRKIGSLWDSQDSEQFFAFSGIQFFHRLEAQKLPEVGCVIRDYWIPRLRAGSKLRGVPGLLRAWEDIGTPERYAVAEKTDSLFKY